ncbi:knotted carbamoyltransferase YgeW [bacterium]|nr:knotted carbamoyltransferase YgeW [bacterium]
MTRTKPVKTETTRKVTRGGKDLNQALERLGSLKLSDLYGSDFLLTWEKSEDQIKATLETALILREFVQNGLSPRVFESGLAISIFRDKSTRTRFSFASAANLLGLTVQELDEEKTQIAHGETVRETAIMISFLSRVIGIRDDLYLGEGNSYMREVARSVEGGYREGILPYRPVLINLQCDLDHPTQSMADLAHLSTHFGGLDRLQGKKLAMSWAYSPSYGKPLSVPQGIIALLSRLGLEITLAHPEGYELLPEVVDRARLSASVSGGSFKVVHSMAEAFDQADIVYPKSWAPLDIMRSRTALLGKGDRNGLKELERECLAINAHFRDWECNEAMMKLTRSGQALYMHCLPADISDVSCPQGEVARSVFERYRLNTYREASWKPYIIAAMMFLALFERPAQKLIDLQKQVSAT